MIPLRYAVSAARWQTTEWSQASVIIALLVVLLRPGFAAQEPFLKSEIIFPMEKWHNHASCVVEQPNGDLLACWFHGSGERTADDVRIEASRWNKRKGTWSPRFTLADTPGLPDGNPCLLVDSSKRLWFFHTTIQANTWESALLKLRISTDYQKSGVPRWDYSEVLHVKPGPEFDAEWAKRVPEAASQLKAGLATESERKEVQDLVDGLGGNMKDKLYRRLGWMTRAHPIQLPGGRVIVPLYHDGFSFSLMAITDDGGRTWHTSPPLIGLGNIQPSIVQKRDGSLYTLMRDNGPAPHRLHQSESRDRGETWSAVTDSSLPNPGSGSEVISLRNGHWVNISNDTERGRSRLAVEVSEDEGRTWPWKRYLEKFEPGPEAGSYHYPSIIQAKDGTLHATYSYHLSRRDLPKDVDGDPAAKTIKHAWFNEAWIRENSPASGGVK
jgi:predicted neuraminidase